MQHFQQGLIFSIGLDGVPIKVLSDPEKTVEFKLSTPLK